MAEETKHKCEEEGCSEEAMCCHLVDYGDFKSEPKDEYEWYCREHARKYGYCPGCGEFWAGNEVFDFSKTGLCANCEDELETEVSDGDGLADFLID